MKKYLKRRYKAVIKVTEFQTYFQVLFETEDSIDMLKNLIVRHQVRKQAVHDTNIAAMVLANKLDYLWTFNTKDFVKFDGFQLLPETLPA